MSLKDEEYRHYEVRNKHANIGNEIWSKIHQVHMKI